MSNDIRTRINQLMEYKGFQTDADVIRAIFQYKKSRKEIKGIPEYQYVDRNKGSFSQAFNGTRKFRPEDYLAIEYVLDTSMAYIIEGKGEMPSTFKPTGIRYAAYTDTIGNYEELKREGILNGSDEYNKMLLDYMIEYKSKNGFEYFAEHDLLPVGKHGDIKLIGECLNYLANDNVELLKVLCEVLPIKLLIRYFDGFMSWNDIRNIQIYGYKGYTSFTDEVLSEAIKRKDLREEFTKTKIISIDSLNKHSKRKDGRPYGDGFFVNFGLTLMLKYALTHEIKDDIRVELLENSIKVNYESFEYASAFEEDDIKINEFGFLTDKREIILYGSIVVPTIPTAELSIEADDLLSQLNKQYRDYQMFISGHSKLSIYANEIHADRKDNNSYYEFFKLMNDVGIKTIPLYKGIASDNKDLFEVNNGNNSKIANGTEETLITLIEAIREIDSISWSHLNGKTYYFIDPSFYMLDKDVNYIMPQDVVVSNKYSNLVRLINSNVAWDIFDSHNKIKVKHFINLIKLYGITKDELEEFIKEFMSSSEEMAQSIDRSSDQGKELAFRMLENKLLVEVYKDFIISNF